MPASDAVIYVSGGGDSDYYLASVPVLPGCVASGKTREQAVANARRAFIAYLELLEARGVSTDHWRGLDPTRAKANLDKIITALKASGAEVLLAGMFAPRSLGKDYVRAFDGIYPDLAGKHGLILYPFFLEGVAMDARLNLDDGLHPNTRGVAEITKKILPSVEQLIERARAKQATGPKG